MRSDRRIGLFGGSFDPVHCGHLRLAEEAVKEFALDTVLFIPARQPPHKREKKLAPARRRLAMLSLAIKPYPRFRISRFELNRSSTTYTYQTVEHFRRRFPGAGIFFIVGSDSLLEMDTWKNVEHLRTLCTFIVGKRRGVSAADRKKYAGSVAFISRPLPAISSSGIRERISDGKPVTGLVPAAVEDYILRHGVYR